MNIAQLLQNQVHVCSEQAAILDTKYGRRRTLTFAELSLAAGKMVSQFRQAGLKPGDTVLVFHPMSAELYVVLLAIFRMGLVAMFVDPSLGKDHIKQCCQLRQPKALVATAKAYLLCAVSPALRAIPYKFVTDYPLPGAIWCQRQANPSADQACDY